MSKHKGLHTHRLRQNPEEERFAKAWEAQNDPGRQLEYLLLRTDGKPALVTERDEVVSATVIQWLGSPVGQGFLRQLGYERGSPQDTEILWAAMTAMVKDIHAPQDQLTKAQWERADAMMARLDREMERK